jgi:hypothetical protein
MSLDDRTDKPPDKCVTVSKGFLFDWDAWIVSLFKRQKTYIADSPQTIDDCKDKEE